MKLVGEAVRGTSFGSQIPTIGIATWGIVKNRNQLEQTDRVNMKELIIDCFVAITLCEVLHSVAILFGAHLTIF